MANARQTKPKGKSRGPRALVDVYSNIHYQADELARGGQGVVFRTADADLAIKQPIDNKSGNLDYKIDLQTRFQAIRMLPIPLRIPISLPLAILRDEPGYVMRLLNGMEPFNSFEMNGKAKSKLDKKELPVWLSEIPLEDDAFRLLHYSETGSTKDRLIALSKCASILARLHSVGLVYGDVSPSNAFVSSDLRQNVWLIDADNLRFERKHGGDAVYTPHFGAPEVVQGLDSSRPTSDCWAFAVMAFRMLALCHPFIGKKVLDPESDQGGWDDEVSGSVVGDLDEQAYAGQFPYLDDLSDDSNCAFAFNLPRELVATKQLRTLFQETFGAGRLEAHRRPSMHFWSMELAKAYDQSLVCPECKMSYFVHDHTICPYCSAQRPDFIMARTKRWEVVIPGDCEDFGLPNRLFCPFSMERHNDIEYEAVLDYKRKQAVPVRGTRPFPRELVFDYSGVE